MTTSKQRAQTRRIERLREKVTEVGVENHTLLEDIRLLTNIPDLLFNTRLRLLFERLFPHKHQHSSPDILLDLLIRYHCTRDGVFDEESYLNFELDAQRRLREEAQEILRRAKSDGEGGVPSGDDPGASPLVP